MGFLETLDTMEIVDDIKEQEEIFSRTKRQC